MATSDKAEHFPQVCIIESPNTDDVRDGRNEGSALSAALTLGKVVNNYYFANNRETLEQSFAQMPSDAALEIDDNGKFPMLFIHFSAHGNKDGIALTDGDFIDWTSLGDLLTKFASASQRLFPESDACIQTVSFSVCHGVFAAKMADQRLVCPFYGIIGSPTAVGWSDSLTAFVTLYHNVCHKRLGIAEGVRRMNAAIGSDLFFALHCARFGFHGGSDSI